MKDILKNKKMIIAFAVLALILTVVFFIRRKRKAEEADETISQESSSLPTATFPLQPYSIAGEYSAAKGSYGMQIVDLQTKLNTKGAGLDVDGKYGPKTEAAVKTYLDIEGGISQEQYAVL